MKIIMVKDDGSKIEINNAVSSVIWTEDDICTAFNQEYGRLPSEHELDETLGRLDVDRLEDDSISLGWEHIVQSVRW